MLNSATTPPHAPPLQTGVSHADACARSALRAHALPMAVSWAAMTGHRDFLVRFAQRRLHDPAWAEDLVHDVFEAVATGRASFAGRSSLRSWLAAILKHKIVDLVRQRSGHDSLDACADDDEQPLLEIVCPQPRPDQLLEARQLLSHALARIDALPKGLRQVLELHVLHEQSSDEVCSTLAITPDNLFVRLHRARRQLLC